MKRRKSAGRRYNEVLNYTSAPPMSVEVNVVSYLQPVEVETQIREVSAANRQYIYVYILGEVMLRITMCTQLPFTAIPKHNKRPN